VLAECGAVLAAVAWGTYWWLAVPRHQICAMTLPAPAGCSRGRVPVAALWSAATAGLYGVAVFLRIRRPRSRWYIVALVALVLGTIRGYFLVLYA
jgi:hypothetical protein